MKKLITSSLLAFVMFVAPVFFIGCSGCKSTPTRTVYVASGITHAGAVAALRGWNEYLGTQYKEIAELAKSDVPGADRRRAEMLAKEGKVSDAWKKYQASQIAVLSAAQAFAKVPPNDPGVATAQDRLNAAVAASTEALAQAIGLLRQFGLKV